MCIMVSENNDDMEKDSSLEEFLVEAEEIVEALNSDLMRLDVLGGDEPDPDLLNSIFRSAHTLKGLSGMFGFELMVEVSHNLGNGTATAGDIYIYVYLTLIAVGNA